MPAEGPVIIVSNHQVVMDSFYLPGTIDRQIQFPAKSEYFTTSGLVGRFQKWFFSSVGQIPVERNAKNAGESLINAGLGVLNDDDVFGIYPEGTRSPDGRIYKGRTGMARLAMISGAPVVPAGMIDTRKANPIGSWILRPTKVNMILGKPIDPHAWAKENGYDPEDLRQVARPFTDFVMKELSALTGHPYVDVYASEVKKYLAAGHGYPAGSEPGGELEQLPERRA